MSRCFPFPPPGYEKKIRLDDVKLIIKEKQKQKKHKKDKEEKERSERKEKEKSEKHKEGEDKREKKHREKKHKKKDKHKSSEDKKAGASLENQNVESKLVPDTKPHDDPRILGELGKRLRNDSGAMDNPMAQNKTPMDQRNINLLEKLEHHKDSNVANTQYLKDASGLENGFIKKISGQTKREVQNKVKDVSSKLDSCDKKNEEKERNKQSSNGKGDGHKFEERDKGRKSEDNKSTKEKKIESIKEPIEQIGIINNFREANVAKEIRDSQRNLLKRKEPELNGFLHDNGIRPNNVSRPVPLSHQNGSGSHHTQNNTNMAVRKAAPTSNHMVNGNHMSSKLVNSSIADVEPGQRPKDFTTDHGRANTSNHVVSNGLITSPHVGIGKKTELGCPTSNNMIKVEQRIINNHRVADKIHCLQPSAEDERKLTRLNFDKAVDWRGKDDKTKIDGFDSRKNGVIEGTKLHSSSKPQSSSLKVKEKSDKSKKDNSDKSVKPPHPDLKYLDQILTVPKVDWPQFHDQDWLFGHSESQAKRPKLASSQPETTKEVWAEAMRLDSEDVIALPYVIPY